MRAIFILFICTVPLASCGTYTPKEVAEPSAISLKQAVFEVSDALNEVQDRVPLQRRSGLLADEVTVVFNVAASSTTTNKAGLTISNVALAGVGGTLNTNAETQTVGEGNRGNTVTIKFKNIATADMSKSSFRPTRVCRGDETAGPCVKTPLDEPTERKKK